MGILEAKKVGVNPQNVLEQAKRYSRGAFEGTGNWNGYRVPFLYSSNGEIIWHIDIRDEKNISRQISGFHTAEALEEMFTCGKAEAYNRLLNMPIDIDRLHYYQKDAIAATEGAMAEGKRQMLLAMATGTGKTFTTVAQIYRLLKSGAAKRVLFLVDRRVLAAQAVTTFNALTTPHNNKFTQEYDVFSQRFQKDDFEEDVKFDPKVLPNEYLTAPNSTHTFVYVSTIQRMCANLLGKDAVFSRGKGDTDIDDDADRLDIPIHAFDVVIADECHRGYTAKDTAIWRQVLEYFDAVTIGLTATPAAHTVAFFKDVVYRYTTEEAILGGYLVDYEAVKIKSEVRINGAFLREGEQVIRVDTETGRKIYDELEDERRFEATEIEQKITVTQSNELIIKAIKKFADEHERAYGRFPKTLIFADNDLPHTSHADQLVNICKEVFNRGDDFVVKITGSSNVDRPLQRIRQFRNRPVPRIVVTVDMLSTGVDIPALEFIVFLRPVKSRILWVQMLGRGTRLCDNIGPGVESKKTHFTIFDCFDGTLIEYFKNTTDFEVRLQQEPVPIEKIIRNIYDNIDRDYSTKVLIKRLRRIEKQMSGKARVEFSKYIPEGDIGRFAGSLQRNLQNDFASTMSILLNKAFQGLLINYERAKRPYIIAPETPDTVTTEVAIKTGQGFQKPEDYLSAFSRFVKENPEHIEAIRILLERPKDWSTRALNELQEKLNKSDFDLERLSTAHKHLYKKLADIISMIKHAAKNEPVLTAEERVNKALNRIQQGKLFTEEQLKWLEYIRHHLIANLTIDESDLRYAPAFEIHGGMSRAKKVFGENLTELLIEINEAVAA